MPGEQKLELGNVPAAIAGAKDALIEVIPRPRTEGGAHGSSQPSGLGQVLAALEGAQRARRVGAGESVDRPRIEP